MLLLTSTSDLLQVITGSAGQIECHASWMDNASGTITAGRTNTAAITTATTTTVVNSPGASTVRNTKFLSVKNDHASVSNAIQIQHTDGTTVITLWTGTLAPGESITLNEYGEWLFYTAGGVIKSATGSGALYNQAVASQTGFAADTYLVGSSIAIPSSGLRVGSRYRLLFDVTKTAAGVATPAINIRVGTAGTTADTSRAAMTFPAQTAVVDSGSFEIDVVARTVGSGTSAVLQGFARLRHGLAATGLSTSGGPIVVNTGGGFDSTVANSIIGASVNGGASAAWTIQLVAAELLNT